MLKQVITSFRCSRCLETKEHSGGCGTGYAYNEAKEKVCYDCCAKDDRTYMTEHGQITLYLSKIQGQYFVGNWPGTLKFVVPFHSKSKTNWGDERIDFWFRGPEGLIWHGKQIGKWNQIARCKRTKKKEW